MALYSCRENEERHEEDARDEVARPHHDVLCRELIDR